MRQKDKPLFFWEKMMVKQELKHNFYLSLSFGLRFNYFIEFLKINLNSKFRNSYRTFHSILSLFYFFLFKLENHLKHLQIKLAYFENKCLNKPSIKLRCHFFIISSNVIPRYIKLNYCFMTRNKAFRVSYTIEY